MDRRGFLKTSVAATAIASMDFPALASKVRSYGKERLKVGILSDTHVINEASQKCFIKALNYFKERRVDAIMIAGDMTDNGMMPEYRSAVNDWYSVCPDDKYPDGKKIERLIVYGNHEIEGPTYGYVKKAYGEEVCKRDAIAPVRDKFWEECWHEKFEPIYIKDVKGYKFIGAHFNRNFIPGLDEFMKSVEDQLPKDKPFFYFQHMHPKGTCSAPWVWGQDDGSVTEILSRYPNAIAFSGHSHTPLTDDRVIWQGAFTSVGTASLRYIIPIGGRENSKVFGSKENVPSQMPVLAGGTGHHGQMMTIYDDCIVLSRHEFENDEDLGNWVIPIKGNSKPLTFEAREKTEKAPQFFDSARVTVSDRKPGKDRYGVEQDQVTVEFPVAVSHDGLPRPLDYEVQVEEAGVDVYKAVLTKRVFSNTYFLGEKKDSEKPAKCVFSVNELPLDKAFRFAVRPCNGFGRKGEPIYSEVFPAGKFA